MFSQTDAAYFATPTGAASRVPLPPRPPKPTLVVSHPVPSDLAKPRDLVAIVNHGPSFGFPPSQKTKQISAEYNDQSSRDTHDVTDTQEPPTGQKRPATGDTSQLTGHASTSNGENPRMHPPPAKRPKKDKASIFIPKKPNRVRSLSW
jgi:senataxin